MMKAILPLMLIALAPNVDAQAIPAVATISDATWTIKPSRRDPGTVQLDMSQGRNSQIGETLRLSDFTGLSEAAMRGDGKPVTFSLRREAGTVTFTGRFSDGVGQGIARLDADPAYTRRLATMGLSAGPDAKRGTWFALVMLDIRSDYIADLRKEGGFGDLSDYIGMKAVGVRPEMVREVKPLLAAPLKARAMMSLAALGVDVAYVRDMRTAFDSLTAQQIVGMKATGVRPADIARFKAIGLYVSPNDATGLRALGVTPDYVQALRSAGAQIDTASQAQSFRALGISEAAVRRTVAQGKPRPSASDVMTMSVRN